MFERCFEKAFRFDFVMIHVGMYTKCSEMFCLEKSLNFEKSVRCEKYLIEQATKSLYYPLRIGRFRILLSFRIALAIPLVSR